MNTSQFMDKQIMDLSKESSLSPADNDNNISSSSRTAKDIINLMNNQQEADDHHNQRDDNGFKSQKEEIEPSYDFQPIRATAGFTQPTSTATGSANNTSRVWSASDTKPNSGFPIRNYGSLDTSEPAKFVLDKDQNVADAAILSEIDRTMKKHADNLLNVLEGVSARLTQLESKSRNLEQLVDDLNVSVENNHQSIDGKMRQLENVLREVQTGVKEVKDKQEIVETQLQLSKLQEAKVNMKPETTNPVKVDSAAQPPASAPQSYFQPSPPVSFLQPQPQPQDSLPSSAGPLPVLPQQILPPTPAQHPVQLPATQQEPYFPTSGQSQTHPPQGQLPYQLPPPTQPHQSAHATPPPPHQPSYQPSPQPPQYSQASPLQPPQLQPPSSGYHPEEAPYAPHIFPPNPPQLPVGSAPSHQLYGPPPMMYEQPSGRSSSGFSSGYGSQSGSGEPYPYGGSASSQFGNTPSVKPSHMSGGGTGYSQPPTARPLPHALPMASGISSGSGGGSSGSPRSGSRVPVDDVVDKVTSMGFSREQVRATVRNLTENGQAVDLNVVLDKLMNGGGIMQQSPQRGGWYGGR